MRNFNFFFFCWLFTYVTFSFSQNFKTIPDSLKKYSYEELHNLMINRKLDKSILYSKVYLLKAKKEDNIEKTVDGYFLVGMMLNNFELNLKYADSAIEFVKNRNTIDLAYVYLRKGRLYYDEKRLKEALNCYLIANKYSKNVSVYLSDNIIFSIGTIKNSQGHYEEAITIFKKCEEHARETKFSDYLRYLLALSEAYHRLNKVELSNKYIEKGISSYKKYDSGVFYLPYFISNRGKNYYKSKQYKNAIQDLTISLKEIQKNNDFSNYAENCFYIGECYHEMKQDSKAIPYYKKVDSVFVAKNDIYPLTIIVYERLINYYKKQTDYKNAILFSEQFIKADKVINQNYKYITNKIAKTYDIQNVISSKQATILLLKKEKIYFVFTICVLFIGVSSICYLLFVNGKKSKKKLLVQKALFEAYIIEREQIKKQNTENQEPRIKLVKKVQTNNLDENIVKYILSCLDKFESEKWYLKKEYNIDLLATEFKTNSGYLSKVINEVKEVSFTQYINTLRIEYIIDKLETEKTFLQYTIQYLSEFSGFNNIQTFTRAFTSHTKMKPSEFIKQLTNKNLD